MQKRMYHIYYSEVPIRSAASPRVDIYAVDLELYFNDAVNLERGLVLFKEMFIRFHLQINVPKPRQTYSCQTGNLTKQQMNKINSANRNMLRKMVNNGFKRKNVSEDDYIYVLSKDDRYIENMKNGKHPEYI